MKKRIFSIAAAVCLLFTAVVPYAPKPVSAATTFTAPQVKEQISGFEVARTGYDATTKSTKVLFEHIKTGARLLLIKNNDTNGGFGIKFDTPADNDKGISHIIEHCVLSGSEKYPCRNIVFDIMNSTYTSYANGYTQQNSTTYPICSANQTQLLKSADVYLDAVFHPQLLKDRRIFEREGIRYELADADTELAYNGIVYNEMQGGSGDIQNAANENLQKTIFNDSNQGTNEGGDPKAITTLTYEELMDTYKKNYHPSNSFMVLYGDVDYEPFLKMIDENYLSSFDKKETTVDRGKQKPFQKLLQKEFAFPVAEGTDIKNKSVISLTFLINDIKELGMEDYEKLKMGAMLMNLDDSDIKKALTESKIAESYMIGMDTSTYQPTISFVAVNADPSQKEAFYDLIMKELKNTVKNGLDTELINSIMRSLKFTEALGNDSNSGLTQMDNACMFDNWFGDPFLEEYSYLKRLSENLDDKVIEQMIEQQLINNTSAALVVTSPQAGLLEENQKLLTQELAKKKASMNDQEKEALIKKTEDFNAWNSQSTPEEVIKSLRAVSLKDIPIEIKERETQETTIDGAKLLTANADADSLGLIELKFDLSHLTMEELLYLRFYSIMVNNTMETANRTESQVLNEMVAKANYVSTSVYAFTENAEDTSAHPVFDVDYYSFEDAYTDTFDLVSDILLQSNVDNIHTYGTRAIANLKRSYMDRFARPSSLANIRSRAYTSPTYRYSNYLTGLECYDFILALEKQIASHPEEVVNRIKEVRNKAFNKNNLTVLFAGADSASEKFKAAMPEFTGRLSDKTYQKAEYTLPVPARREALAINSTTQYVVANGSLSDNQVPQSGKADVITAILDNLLLIPEIRLKGGAYGAYAYTVNNNYIAITTQDKNFANSLATIDGTDEFLKTLPPLMSEDILECYKLPAFAAASQSSGELFDALNVLTYKIKGITTQDRIDTLTEIKETEISDIDRYAEYLERINTNLNYIVAAPMSEIDKHRDLFDEVITLP